jgi:hypothetical protein
MGRKGVINKRIASAAQRSQQRSQQLTPGGRRGAQGTVGAAVPGARDPARYRPHARIRRLADGFGSVISHVIALGYILGLHERLGNLQHPQIDVHSAGFEHLHDRSTTKKKRGGASEAKTVQIF